jgi:protein-tyrosine-phosphatase
LNVLFLCTGNSSRSLMAEAILNELGRGRFHGFSAGSSPQPQPDQAAIALLERKGYGVAGLRSKSWDEFSTPGGPSFDYVITVCNDVLRQTRPKFRGAGVKYHWDIPDPPAAKDVQATCEQAYAMLLARIGTVVFGTRPRA